MWVTVKENRITGVYTGDKIDPPKDEFIIDVPTSFNGVVGTYLDELDDNFRLKPLLQRYKEGTLRDLPKDMKINALGEPRYKEDADYVLEGRQRVPRGKKLIVDDRGDPHLIDQTPLEMYNDGVISREEWVNIAVRDQRTVLLYETDHYMLPDSPITEKEREAIALYRQVLRDMTETVVPGDIVWPEMPKIKKAIKAVKDGKEAS